MRIRRGRRAHRSCDGEDTFGGRRRRPIQGTGGDLRFRDHHSPGIHRAGDIHAGSRARPGGDQSALGWIVNAYAIAFGGCVMAAGAIGDQIGRKRCFVAGLWIFIATSLLIGLTPNLLLLTCRAPPKASAVLGADFGHSLLAQEFEGAERTRAFSFLGTAFGVGLAFGPMASGS